MSRTKSRDKAFEEIFVRVDSSLIEGGKYFFHRLILKGPFGEAKLDVTADLMEDTARFGTMDRWKLCEPNGKERGEVRNFAAAVAFIRIGKKARK